MDNDLLYLLTILAVFKKFEEACLSFFSLLYSRQIHYRNATGLTVCVSSERESHTDCAAVYPRSQYGGKVGY